MFRMVYAKPFCIVYGTQSEDTWVTRHLHDGAMYLAHSHIAAHMTFVQVLSDVEYLARLVSGGVRKNVIFLGGDYVNAAFRFHTSDGGISPVEFFEDGGFAVDRQFYFRRKSGSSTDGASIIFTFPINTYRSLAVCIHASVASDYLHITRLMWPTIPPMV